MWHGSRKFPSGSSGFALLALRLSSACAMALLLPADPSMTAGTHALCLLLGAAMMFGIATPLSAMAGVGLIIGCGMPGGTAWVGLAWGGVFIALALLGAGAWSFDALLFGKRVIRISG